MMKKIIIWIVVVLLLLIAGFYALNTYIYNEKQGEETPAVSSYFRETMQSLGVRDIGQPIEGFDSNLLIMAFPGLVPSDFNLVETLEGRYELEGEEIVFVRDGEGPVSSAERTLSEEGYETLLENLSIRLAFPVTSESDALELIEKINTGERVSGRTGQEVEALNVKISILELVEDSRCPADVVCIWAGTVKVKTLLHSGLGSGEQIFELDKPITTEAEEVTLVQVEPFANSGSEIASGDYVFYFQIKKR